MKQKKKEIAVVGGLSALGDVMKHLELALPKLEVPSLEGLPGDIEAQKKVLNDIRMGVTGACEYLRGVTEQRVKYENDPDGSRIVRMATADGVTKAETYLNQILGHKQVLFRQVGAVALLKATLSVDFTDEEQGHVALHGLEDRKIVVQDRTGQGPLTIGYQHYVLGADWNFGPEDSVEITEAVTSFSRRLKASVKVQRQKLGAEIEARATVTWEEVLNGKNGNCLLFVPDESYLDKGNNDCWRGGGKLLVEVTDDNVIPIIAVGAIATTVENMVGGNVRIPFKMLKRDVPPGTGKVGQQNAEDWAMRNMGLSQEMAKWYVFQEKILWHMLRRAISYPVELAKTKAELEAYRAKAEITTAELFGLNGAGGKPVAGKPAICEFEGTFRLDGPRSVSNLFFTADYAEENGGTVGILEVPKHLEPVLGQFIGKRFPVAEGFHACPDPLGRMLRAIRNKTFQALEIKKGEEELAATA